MKKLAYMLAVVMLVVAAGLSSASAQNSTQMTADIPFAFHVGDQSFAAGEYEVRLSNPSSPRRVVHLRSKDGSANVLIQTNSVVNNDNGDAKLVFNRYGDRYYFAEAWTADTIGMRVAKSQGERATAKELANIKRGTEMVVLNRKR